MTKEEREKAIDLLDNLKGMIEDNQGNDYDFAFRMGIEALKQEPKTGHWIKSRDWYGNNHFICSECGNDIVKHYADDLDDNYCSMCGAKMVSEG